jgi:two-component system, chemotaxis family, protein-glutamate methylesterase/glutaminase
VTRTQDKPDIKVPRDRKDRVFGKYRIIAVGESAGGFHSLCELLAPLPENLSSAILVVQHLSPSHKSFMADLLLHKTAMMVRQAQDGEAICDGVVYIAPPDWHLLSEPGNVRLLRTPAVRYHRPSVDLLFESVAVSYGRHAIAVVLSGSGNDGATGIRAVKMAGGKTIVEDPGKAEFPSMPYAAIATGCVDMVLPLSEIGRALVELCSLEDE